MNSSSRGLAIVTGASRGIGRAIAHRLSQDGFALVLVGRNSQELITTQKKLVTSSCIVNTDLNAPEAPDLILSASHSPLFQQTPLTALINNAGIIHRNSFSEMSEQTWRDELELNLMAPVRLIKKSLPELQDGSVIVNVSSTLGIRPIANTSAYSASKAALNSLTQCLALELAPRIRVCSVCPGLIDTPIHEFYGKSETEFERKSAHAAQPMKRMGHPEEIAAMVSFLISPESAWTTGSLHVVDGGIGLL